MFFLKGKALSRVGSAWTTAAVNFTAATFGQSASSIGLLMQMSL